MRPEIGRRAFVGGTMAASAGLIALLGGEDDPVQAQGHNHTQVADPILQLFIRESVAIRREIKRDRLRGEHARRYAAALRMLATYGQPSGLDDIVQSQLRQLVREQGREALLQVPLDYDKAVAELRAQGAIDPEELPNPNLLTREQRLTGLNELLRDGLTPIFAHHAQVVDRAAPVLDRYGSVAAPAAVQVAFRQDPISQAECEAAWESQILLMKAASIFVCLTPPLWEICVVLQLDILMMEAMQWYICSDNP